MKAKILLSSGLVLAALAGQEARAQASAANNNVIIYIGDGFGLAPKTAARMAMGQGTAGKRFTSDAGFQALNLDKLKYNATVTTHSLNSWITDSAPGAAVYACGKQGKQDNEVISLNPATGASIETILEAAKKQGYAVGLVSTARITHATPAAFASHIWYRDLEDYISAQYIASTQPQYEAIFNSSPTASYRYTAARDWVLPTPKVGVELDVILGGGARHFMPRSRTAGVTSTYETIVDRNGAAIINPATGVAATLKGNRADDVDLVSYAVNQRNYGYVNSRDALNNINLSQYGAGGKKLLGLFNASHVNFEQDRQTNADWEPSLAEMTHMAIEVLKAKSNGKGFFLMVEAGRIDHLEHANAGGISVVANPAGGNQYTVDSDKPAYALGGESNYVATPSTARTTNVYASDYMIKEVMAFDYAVAEGRALLATPATTGKTLIFSTSDHECGGFAVTGLHDEADAQGNGTKIRTYSGQITKSVAAEAGYATPTNLVRGDGGVGGWFPDYVMNSFQGKDYPQPASATGKRIVVAYGSNPLTNGNGTRASTGVGSNQGATPGNHTPQDIWVGAEDNANSADPTFGAQGIAGQGLLDNTSITPLMARFLGLDPTPFALRTTASISVPTPGLELSPVPFSSSFAVAFTLPSSGAVTVELFDEVGRRVQTVFTNKDYASGAHSVAVDGSRLRAGLYIATVTVNGQVVSKRTIKL